MNEPLVSVVVASYNRAQLLRRALASVAAQTVTSWECLVCDDGSTDDTHALVRAVAGADPRFRLSLGPRFGLPGGPRNRGIREARAPWIAFLDDDDLWHPRKLETQLTVAETLAGDAISTPWLPLSDADPDAAVPWPADEPRSAGVPNALRVTPADVLFLRQPFPTTSSNMVRRAALIHAGGFSEGDAYRAVEDYDLWLRLVEAPGFAWWMTGGAPLVAYRELGADSISTWTDHRNQDYTRRRWAYLECLSRSTARLWHAARLNDKDRRDAVIALRALAEECAHRSRVAGWRHASLLGYLTATLYTVVIGSVHEAALIVSRTLRFPLFAPATARSRMPDSVGALARRAFRNAVHVLTRSPAPLTPVGPTALAPPPDPP